MTLVGAALWGLFGGFAVESLEFWTAVRRHQRWPWENPGDGPTLGLLAYILATTLRLGVGAGVAVAARTSEQSATAWVAMIVGAGTPLLLEKATALIPLVLQVGVTAVTATSPREGESGEAALFLEPLGPRSAGRNRPDTSVPDSETALSDGEGQRS
ncbi:hypothetical protein ACH4UM_34455 [Streptomyces sp. NPDC020801]|uniref:hypothetical protein n=1 Tax=unclassified Streptomyces TaxID=2593676 RepID=UPI003798688F